MPVEVRTHEEAKVLAQAVRDGRVPDKKRTEALTALRIFRDAGTIPELEPDVERSPRPEFRPIKTAGTTLANVGKDVLAVGELGLTIASGGLGEILGGFGAAFKMLLGGSNNQAVADIQATADFFTLAPRTKRGKALLNDIAVPLMALESGADRISETMSFGNPFAATFIKTTLLGGVELALPAKGTRTAVSVQRTIARQKKEVKRIADDLGINPDINDMAAGIVDAARRMTPDERAANAPALQQAMREAAKVAADERTVLFNAARETRTFIETRSVRKLAIDMRNELKARGFDLDEMPIVNKRLLDMQSKSFEVGGPLVARLNELEIVRRRISANRSASPSENAALNSIKKGLDDFLDNEFNNIATESGSAISGDVAGVAAWKEARASNVRWKENFSSDKTISQLIEKNATPEQYRQWLMGASTMGANKQAALTIRRMKEILGKDHPAIEGIRQDFLFEIAEPLLKDQPNYAQFVRNYDATIRRNPSLVKELNLNQGDMRQLLDFSRAQNRLPLSQQQIVGTDLTRALAQFSVGHQIAKASLRVNIARAIANRLFRVGEISKKQVYAEIMNVKFGEPAIPKKSLLAAEFITGAAITGLTEEQ